MVKKGKNIFQTLVIDSTDINGNLWLALCILILK